MEKEIKEKIIEILKNWIKRHLLEGEDDIADQILELFPQHEKEILEEIEESQHNFPENLNEDEAVGWDMAHENIKAKIKK